MIIQIQEGPHNDIGRESSRSTITKVGIGSIHEHHALSGIPSGVCIRLSPMRLVSVWIKNSSENGISMLYWQARSMTSLMTTITR